MFLVPSGRLSVLSLSTPAGLWPLRGRSGFQSWVHEPVQMKWPFFSPLRRYSESPLLFTRTVPRLVVPVLTSFVVALDAAVSTRAPATPAASARTPQIFLDRHIACSFSPISSIDG